MFDFSVQCHYPSLYVAGQICMVIMHLVEKRKLLLGRQSHFPSNFSCKCQQKLSYSTGDDSFLKEPALLKAHVGDYLIQAIYSSLHYFLDL